MPIGPWLLQIPVLLRLTASFFVGFYESGLAVRTWPRNSIHVRNSMTLPLLVACPWQIIEIPLRTYREDPTFLDTRASDVLFIFTSFMGLLRIIQFTRDLQFLHLSIGYLADVVIFFLFGGIIEFVLEFLWMTLPELYCQDPVRARDRRHMLLDCWSNNCSLFTVNLEGNNSCYAETWWSLMHYNTRLTTTTYNVTNNSPVIGGGPTTLKVVSLIQSVSDVAVLPDFHHFFVYTSTKGVGIGYGGAMNHWEALYVIFLFAAGHYFYNWKISAIIDTIALAGDAGRVDGEKQLGIVHTFCQMHDADKKTM